MNQEIIEQFLIIKRAQGCAPATISAYSHDLNRFWWYCATHDVPDSRLTANAISLYLATYITDRDEAGQIAGLRSNARRLTAIRQFIDYCHAEGILPNSAKAPYPIRQPPAALKFVPDRGQIRSFLRHAAARGLKHEVICTLLYYTGCRASELARLRWSDVIANDNAIQVIRGKGRHSRVIPLCPTATAVLGKARAVLDITPSQYVCCFTNRTTAPSRKLVWNVVHAIAVKSGIPLTPHTLRHAFATHIAAKTPDPLAIATLLGHRSLSTAMLYVHHTQRKLADVVRTLEDKT